MMTWWVFIDIYLWIYCVHESSENMELRVPTILFILPCAQVTVGTLMQTLCQEKLQNIIHQSLKGKRGYSPTAVKMPWDISIPYGALASIPGSASDSAFDKGTAGDGWNIWFLATHGEILDWIPGSWIWFAQQTLEIGRASQQRDNTSLSLSPLSKKINQETKPYGGSSGMA